MTPWGQCPRGRISSTTEDYWNVSVLYLTCWIMEQRQLNTTPTATASTSCCTQEKSQKTSNLGLVAARLNTAAVKTLHLLLLTLVAQQWVSCWGCPCGWSALPALLGQVSHWDWDTQRTWAHSLGDVIPKKPENVPDWLSLQTHGVELWPRNINMIESSFCAEVPWFLCS